MEVVALWQPGQRIAARLFPERPAVVFGQELGARPVHPVIGGILAVVGIPRVGQQIALAVLAQADRACARIEFERAILEVHEERVGIKVFRHPRQARLGELQHRQHVLAPGHLFGMG